MSTANYLLPYQGNSSHGAQEATVPQQGWKKYTVTLKSISYRNFLSKPTTSFKRCKQPEKRIHGARL